MIGEWGDVGGIAPQVAAIVGLVHQSAYSLLQVAAKGRFPAYAQHRAPCADAVSEVALIGAPVALHQTVVAHAFQENIVDVPNVLPFRDLESRIEMVREPRDIDAHRQRR